MLEARQINCQWSLITNIKNSGVVRHANDFQRLKLRKYTESNVLTDCSPTRKKLFCKTVTDNGSRGMAVIIIPVKVATLDQADAKRLQEQRRYRCAIRHRATRP